MKRKMQSLLCVLLAALPLVALSQGTFGNLNFEQANPVPAGQPFIVAASNGIPGWVSYLGPTIFYDTVSLGGAAISLHDSASLFYQPLQGSYGILLQGSGAGPDVSAAIGQTAQIPIGSLSLRYWADPLSRLQVTFGGQLIEMVKLGSTVNYDVLGGDISMFAGQTAELRFTGPANAGGFFDNVFFSAQQIPEPSAVGLFGLGALLFGCRSRLMPKR